jgi:polysaccharide export outer membrane protein
MTASRLPTAFAVLLALGACADHRPSPLPAGQQAYATIPEVARDDAAAQRLRPGDRLAIRVFGEPELTSEQYRIDAAGYLQVPLVGELIAAGLSPEELRRELTRRLGARFIRDPQVAVAVAESTKSRFAVEGHVEQPGVYEADQGTTLLSALAQARSPNKTAKLDEILVFRVVNGQRMGARFDLRDIRAGIMPDPQILPGDTIVVGFSEVKGAFRDFLEAAPIISIFTLF